MTGLNSDLERAQEEARNNVVQWSADAPVSPEIQQLFAAYYREQRRPWNRVKALFRRIWNWIRGGR